MEECLRARKSRIVLSNSEQKEGYDSVGENKEYQFFSKHIKRRISLHLVIVNITQVCVCVCR